MYCTVLCLALLPFLISFSTGQQISCPLVPKCCPDGECYDLCPPWTTLSRPVPPPNCVENPVKYLLSNRSNPKYPVVFSTANFSKIQDYYNASKPTIMVFHGYHQSEDSADMRNITSVYLTKVDANAIFVDYSNISMGSNYYQAVSDIRVAARYVIEAVEILIELGTNKSAIHLIGHSLGAHLAAYVAKGIPDIGRLTGLDPAGPGFTNENREVRFCQGDAVYMEAIHTNGRPFIGFGTPDKVADVDFWVNGGWDQPYCPPSVYELFPLLMAYNQINQTFLDGLTCSHRRSVDVYNDALACNCTIWGVVPTESDLSIRRDEIRHRKYNRLCACYLRADWVRHDRRYRQRMLYRAN